MGKNTHSLTLKIKHGKHITFNCVLWRIELSVKNLCQFHCWLDHVTFSVGTFWNLVWCPLLALELMHWSCGVQQSQQNVTVMTTVTHTCCCTSCIFALCYVWSGFLCGWFWFMDCLRKELRIFWFWWLYERVLIFK